MKRKKVLLRLFPGHDPPDHVVHPRQEFSIDPKGFGASFGLVVEAIPELRCFLKKGTYFYHACAIMAGMAEL